MMSLGGEAFEKKVAAVVAAAVVAAAVVAVVVVRQFPGEE